MTNIEQTTEFDYSKWIDEEWEKIISSATLKEVVERFNKGESTGFCDLLCLKENFMFEIKEWEGQVYCDNGGEQVSAGWYASSVTEYWNKYETNEKFKLTYN